jgi:uncharacterized membrane protein YhaH (DUF805 family)
MNWGHILFSFSGRINRAKYWLTILVTIIIYLVLVEVPQMVTSSAGLLGVLGLAYFVLSLWIGIAAGAKRLHDLNRSGAWLLVFYFAPAILGIIFLVMAWSAIGASIMAGQMPNETELLRAGGMFAVFGLIGFGFFLWWLIWFGCLRGTVGTNQYGPDPLEGKI